LDAEDIRRVYDYVEEILDNDFHYWLQRGAFEVEAGDPSKHALHDLRRAMTTEGGEDDPYVLTEYSYLRFRMAQSSRTSEGIAWGKAAFEDVRKVVLRSGLRSPHTFVVLARDGVPWLHSADMPRTEKVHLMRQAIHLLKSGARLDAVNTRVAEVRETAITALEHAVANAEAG
jgi:hypothetical protein